MKTAPGEQRILFNLAIICQKLSMHKYAAITWKKFLAQNSLPEWRREPNEYLQAVKTPARKTKKADAGVIREHA